MDLITPPMGGSFPGTHASVILLVFHGGVATADVPVMDEDPDTWVAAWRGMRACFLACQWHSLPGPSKLSGRLLSSLGTASLIPLGQSTVYYSFSETKHALLLATCRGRSTGSLGKGPALLSLVCLLAIPSSVCGRGSRPV